MNCDTCVTPPKWRAAYAERVEHELRIAAVLQEITGMLGAAEIDTATADAELLLGHVLGISRGRVQALTLLGETLSAEDRQAVLALATERASRVPLQHLTGRGPFRNIELELGPGVFVPRPETETVAGLAIEALRAVPNAEPIAVDLCTGSGAIALAIAQEVPTAQVWAIEQSPEAHAWADRNIARLGGGRVTLLRGDACHAATLLSALTAQVDVLVSNPPYVPRGMVPRDPEVREHDPALALYGGEDGLDIIRCIAREAHTLLAPGGTLVLEHAEHQGAAVRSLLTRYGWRTPATHPDLTLRDRATTATR